jgi:type IV secretory pathway TrbL component
MGACLGIQLAQAAIVLGAVRVFFTPTGSTILGVPASQDGSMGVVICLCMLWILIKIPGWMKQFVLGAIGQRQGRGLLGQLVHTYMMVKTLGMATGVLKGAKAARRAGTATRAAKAGQGTTAGSKAARRPAAAGPVRRAPAPAGAPVFSHAPAAHTPLGTPAGTAGVPPFSHTPSPAGSPTTIWTGRRSRRPRERPHRPRRRHLPGRRGRSPSATPAPTAPRPDRAHRHLR